MDYYLMGICGAGMSAMAHGLLDLGHKVFGSDISRSKFAKGLEERGVCIDYTQSGINLEKKQNVFASSAIESTNKEKLYAQKMGISVQPRQTLLHELSAKKTCISVTGAHGKSTTSTFLSHVLTQLDLDPSYILGASSASLKGNGHFAKGQLLVCEADESDGSNLAIDTDYALVLNYDVDHLNVHKSEQNLQECYKQFIKGAKKEVIYCSDDPFLMALKPSEYSYGFKKDAYTRALNVRHVPAGMVFDCRVNNQEYSNIKISLMGQHNVLNSLAIITVASILKLDMARVFQALSMYLGTDRRLEKKAENQRAIFYDDYAHHPNEIRATLNALKKNYPQRHIISVFEPHSLYRFMDCFEAFCKVFKDEEVILTDIYDKRVCEKSLYEKFVTSLRELGANCKYVPLAKIREHILQYKGSDELVVTLGAGKLFEVHDEI